MDVLVKVGAMLVDAGVRVEQEVDKRISATQNEKCSRAIYRFTNHIVSENLLINRENIFQLALYY